MCYLSLHNTLNAHSWPLHLLTPFASACTYSVPTYACLHFHTCLHLFFPSCPLVQSCPSHCLCEFILQIYSVNLLSQFTLKSWSAKYSMNLFGEMLSKFTWWNESGKLLRELTQWNMQQMYSANLLTKFTQQNTKQISLSNFLSNLLSEILSKFTRQNT